MSNYRIILVVDRRKQASRVSSAILFCVLFFICFIIKKTLSQMYMRPTWSTFFVESLLSKENVLCLQTRRNAHSFLRKEKDPIANHINLAEDQVVRLYVYFYRIVEKLPFCF